MLATSQLEYQEQMKAYIDKLKTPLEFPYSCIGIVTFYIKSTSYFSTGTIVGENLILTAAHSCFDLIKGKGH